MTGCKKLPVSHRLVHSHEFDRVFRECQFRVGNSALLFLARPNHQEFNRLGMVVGKKHTPLAVQRNRVKRLIREAFRNNMSCEQTGLDIVVLTRPGIRQVEGLGTLLADSFHRLRCQVAGEAG